jgi:hypothetical protein
MEFTYKDAERLLEGRSKRDLPCPFCSHLRKRGHQNLPCFGLARVADDKIVFKCQNCGEGGPLSRDWGESGTRGSLTQHTKRHESRTERQPASNQALAQQHWQQTVPPEGTLAEEYWRYRRLELPMPPTVRFHPYAQTLTIAAALPEYDSEATWIPPRRVSGVQRIKIDLSQPNGRSAKMALGPIAGHPMVVHQNLEKLTLLIGEGVEKTCAAGRAYNVDAWGVGGKTMFLHLTDVIPAFIETVLLLKDPDAEKEIAAFADRLVGRGLEVLVVAQVGGNHGQR